MTTRDDILVRICRAIERGCRENGNWKYATNCFCTPSQDIWNYEFDTGFLDGLAAVAQDFAANYWRGERLTMPTTKSKPAAFTTAPVLAGNYIVPSRARSWLNLVQSRENR